MRKADLIIAIFIAIVLITGITYFIRAKNNIENQTPDRPSVEETLNKIGDGEVATLDSEDDYEEEEPDTSTYEPEEPSTQDLIDLNKTRGEEATTAASNTTAPKSYDAADANKKHLVVAGTFKQMVNANTQLKTFKKMGYQHAYIGKFNKSAYASLVVDRFATSKEAQQLVKTLKSKGIDAYVHKKR
jgi:cell division septation protein DedD